MKPKIINLDQINGLRMKGKKMILWFEERPFIFFGYRIGYSSIKDLTLSALSLHNETLNFWTHFLSALWILTELIQVLHLYFTGAATGSATILVKPRNLMYLLSGQLGMFFCLFSSSLYHLYKDRGATWCQRLLQLDQLGIVTVTFLQAFIGIQLAFSKHGAYGDAIFLFVSLLFLLNLALMTLPCSSSSAAPAHCQSLKVACIIAMIAFLFCVFMAWYFLFATKEEIDLFFYKMLLSYGILGLAFFFYRTKYPERLFFMRNEKYSEGVRWFIETFTQSHILWHILITVQ